MTTDQMNREGGLDPYRYGENNSRPFFLNWEHYLEAHRAIVSFSRQDSADSPRSESEDGPNQLVESHLPQIPEENRLLPVDGYFSLYSDLLGFSKEVSMGGKDSLPDFYGAAFVAAGNAPVVQVYLLSDSCIAFAATGSIEGFVGFVSGIVANWLADGLIPQCFIGYDSFVERKPFADSQPPNFFGTQITGTALPDAAKFQEENKPLGSRILLTDAARSHWPTEHLANIVQDAQGKYEFIPARLPKAFLFDCLYYLLCLREHEPDSRAFDHYVWSFASRAVGGGVGIPKLAVRLAAPYFADSGGIEFEKVIDRINTVIVGYESAMS